jgi:hypothetical protein
MLPTRHYCPCRYNAHYKAGLVEVVGVLIKNTMLRLHVLYKPESITDSLRILAECPLIVILPVELDLQLWFTLYKVCSLITFYWFLILLSAERISHILYSS